MRLELDARALRLLRRLPRVNVYSLLELTLLAGLATQCARLIWAVVTPVGPLGDWRPAEPVVAQSPGAILRGFDPFFRISGASGATTVVTSLQLVLFGTRIDEASGGGSAIIAGPDGVQQSVAVGAEIVPGVRLKSVAFDHVTIDRGGVAEDLFLDQSRAAEAVASPDAGSPGLMPGAPVPGGGTTFAQLRADIGFIPRLDGGRVSGLVVRSQGSGVAFRQAKLRDGDIVTAIGGQPVSGAGDLERLAGQFAKGGNLAITVERGNETIPLSITIAGS